jgi:hypothetical protein
MNIVRRSLGCSLLFVVASTLGWAQVSASMSGHVEDASGAAVSGVNVTIASQETGATRTVTTDGAGNYNASALPVGPQEIRASKTGFKTEIRSGVRLAVGQDAVVNLKLEVGELSQQVTVTAEAPVVNTTTSSVSGLVGEREVKELPLNGRSFDNLVALNPGAISYALKSANTSTSNGNTFVVAGRRPSDYILLMNGIEYTGSSQLAVTPGGVSGELLGIDAVREFNVLSDTYSAEYGKRAGAQVTVVTQSGSNHVHGSLFEFLRNSALDARSFLDKGSVPPFRRNQFGGSLGGPIKKDKLFLFGNYEGFQQSLAVSNVSVVPDALARQGQLPDATTGIYAPVLPANPTMLKYMSYWPVANGSELMVRNAAGNLIPTGTATSFNNPKQSIHENFGTTRADYILRDADTLSAAYTIDDGNSIIPQVDPLFGSALALRGQVASLEETHIFSARLLNSARFGFSRAAYNLNANSVTSLDPSLDFVSGQGPGGIVIGGGTTTTGASALTSAGPNNAAGAWNRRNLFTYADNVQWTHGIHQVTFGGWLQRMRDNEDSASRQLGVATFASLTTFLQGTTSNFQVIPSANELGWRTWFGAWFVEDNIRLRPNLTLRVGLRDEFNNGYNEVFGRAANYITDGSGVLLTTPRVADSVYTQNNAKHLLGPRIGLAWDPFGDGKTAVRAGYGIYYSQIDALAFLMNSLPPYNGSATYTGALSSFLPITYGQQPLPGTIFAPQGVQADAKTPTVEEWNLTVERQLTSNTVLRVAYVGSFGYHGLLNIDPNSIPAQVCTSAAGCASGGLCTATTCGATTGLASQGALYIPAGAKRPNQNLSGGFFWYTEGNSSYNGLQTDVTRRMTNGLQIRANFTWSKSLDMNSGLTGAQAQNQAQMILNRNDVRQDWGPSALNAARQASISGSYALPFGRGKHFFNGASGVADKLASGWQINGIATLLSGFPFTPQVGANYSGDGDTRNPDRPSLNPAFTGPVVLGSPSQWFNPAAFVRPTPGTYGNLGRSVYEGPGLANADVSVTKLTTIRESVSLQFRAEFFNLLNRSNFGTPNATVFSGATLNGSAGLITTQATFPRQIQFGLKLVF